MVLRMRNWKNQNFIKIIALLLVFTLMIPLRASGAVKPIEDMENALEDISEEEKGVLEKLFAIAQNIEDTKREEGVISEEIEGLQLQIEDLKQEISRKQADYDLQLEVLQKVLVNYQRGGPASYLEILLGADNLTTFLKRINIIKDLSRNVSDLLANLETGKKTLEEEKSKLDEKAVQLEQKKQELLENLQKNETLQQEQEKYLASLQEERLYFEGQLTNLKDMWAECRLLFTGIVGEITRIIGTGYFTMEDLNLSIGFIKMQGAINEDTFNNILAENSKLTPTNFRFEEDKVTIEVPKKHLVLTGNFVKAGESAVKYEVVSGTFYDIPLEAAAIEELFLQGPLLIDFKTIAGDMVMIDFTLTRVQSLEGKLTFEIKPEW